MLHGLALAHLSVTVRDRWVGERQPGWRGPLRPRTHVLALVVRYGSDLMELGARRRMVALTPGQWFYCRPGCVRRERIVDPSRCHYCCWATWQGPGLAMPEPRREWAIISDPMQRLLAQLERVRELLWGPPAASQVAYAHFAALLGELELAARGGGGDARRPWRVTSASPPSELARQVDALLLPRLDHLPGVAEIAEALHISPSTLMHRYRREAGSTLKGRARFLRMREAKRLLRAGAAVGEAARMLGLSPSAFSTVFRKEFGATPSAWRARGEPDAEAEAAADAQTHR